LFPGRDGQLCPGNEDPARDRLHTTHTQHGQRQGGAAAAAAGERAPLPSGTARPFPDGPHHSDGQGSLARAVGAGDGNVTMAQGRPLPKGTLTGVGESRSVKGHNSCPSSFKRESQERKGVDCGWAQGPDPHRRHLICPPRPREGPLLVGLPRITVCMADHTSIETHPPPVFVAFPRETGNTYTQHPCSATPMSQWPSVVRYWNGQINSL
jgi:hypothetical protein